MNESHLTGYIGSLMQFIVAGYALRLNRRFGTARVGWSLFGAFSLLALLQLIQSSVAMNTTLDSVLKVNVTYALISFLLLIGMLHLETMLKERLRMETLEQQMRAELEIEVKSKTAHLTRAIEELMREMEETKRMSEIIKTTETTMFRREVAIKYLEEVKQTDESFPALACLSVQFDSEDEKNLVSVVDHEWMAHF